MTYPEAVDRFVEKLNKADTVYVIEDEELVLEDGVFEGELAHDNVKNESVMVFTGPKMSGERIENFFLSIPSNAPWKRVIKVFSDAPKVYVTYETTGDQVEAEDINRVQESIVNTQTEVERYKAANDQAVEGINVRLTTAENNKAEKTYVDTELLKKADKATTYTKTETDDRIQAIVGAAPEALDTLAEIAEALNNDPDFAATVTNLLAQKVDKVPGKGLSTEDFTTVEKQKLAGIEEDANKYIHPSTHPASMIVETSEKRFVSDIEKAAWNAKETPAGAQAKADAAETSAKSYADNIGTALSGIIGSLGSLLTTVKTNIVAAINSLKSELDVHQADDTQHITSTERTIWNNKLDASAYTAADVLAKVKTVDGDGSGLDADLLDGAHAGNGPNNVLKLDSGGFVPLPNIPGTLTGKSADMVDGKHFSDIQNDAQAKVDTHASLKQTHGISSGYYIAKTSRSDQLPDWNDIQGKPDLALASDLAAHKADNAPHQYGNRFAWEYNSITDSLDLVVIE